LNGVVTGVVLQGSSHIGLYQDSDYFCQMQ